jgi:hypothetical protein
VDELLEMVRALSPHLELKYNKFYIGLATNGQPNNFVVFKPQKNAIRIEPRVQKTDDVGTALESAGLDVMDYDNRWGRYRIRLEKGDVTKHRDLLRQLFEAAYRESGGGEA